jgi:hypothetical protein
MTPDLRAVAAHLENAHGIARSLPEHLHHERRMLAESIALAMAGLRNHTTRPDPHQLEAAALGEPAPALTVGDDQ